jgi:hypothetical protein
MNSNYGIFTFIVGIIFVSVCLLLWLDKLKLSLGGQKIVVSEDDFSKIVSKLELLKSQLPNLHYTFKAPSEILINGYGQSGFDVTIKNEIDGVIIYGSDGWHTHVDFYHDSESKDEFIKKALKEIVLYLSNNFRIVETKTKTGFLKSANFEVLENGEWPVRNTQGYFANPFIKPEDLDVSIWSNEIVSSEKDYYFIQKFLE